jgi:hypothetical protein
VVEGALRDAPHGLSRRPDAKHIGDSAYPSHVVYQFRHATRMVRADSRGAPSRLFTERVQYPAELSWTDADRELANLIGSIVSELDERFPWPRDARCRESRGVDFFPRPGKRDYAVTAAAICDGCAVVRECFQYASANDLMDGVWGAASFDRRGPRPVLPLSTAA